MGLTTLTHVQVCVGAMQHQQEKEEKEMNTGGKSVLVDEIAQEVIEK